MGTSASPERVLRSDARRNRGLILEAAKLAFAEHGADAQMDDIARRAGVGVGTLYRHFATKDALIGALVAQKLSGFSERARARLGDEGDPFEILAGLLREQAEHMASDAAEQRLVFAIAPHDMGSALPVIAELRDALNQLIERAKAQGGLREDFGVDDVPPMMCGLGGMMAADACSPIDYDWRRQLEFVLDGLRASRAP